MPVVFFNEGLVRIAEVILNQTNSPINTYVLLFTNDIELDAEMTNDDFVAVAIPGVDPLPLINRWVITPGDGVADCLADPTTWTFPANDGTLTVYGWAVYDSNSVIGYPMFFGDLLRDVEGNPAPYPIPAAGGALTLNVDWKFRMCPEEEEEE